jgi:ABC-type antimicrobial peptide transport system permease subunit
LGGFDFLDAAWKFIVGIGLSPFSIGVIIALLIGAALGVFIYYKLNKLNND